MQQIPFGKRPKKLPSVLGSEEVSRLIACVPTLKHRTVLLTLYAAGLRLSEATHLQVADIDSRRMLLNIRQGKGSKQRLVPLSPRLLQELRSYWKQVRPATFLFAGKTPDMPLANDTVEKACKLAAALARIPKHVTPHTLRHSYRILRRPSSAACPASGVGKSSGASDRPGRWSVLRFAVRDVFVERRGAPAFPK